MPGIPSEQQAPKTAALRKKTLLVAKAFCRHLIRGKVIFGKLVENARSGKPLGRVRAPRCPAQDSP
jgi:hypothetical protein